MISGNSGPRYRWEFARFLPFIVFAISDRFLGPEISLVAGASTSAILLTSDLFTPNRSPKLLENGTFILFCGLALYGLLAIVVLSMLIRRPFTLQYARERVAREHWSSPQFVRTNYVITSAFAVMEKAEFALLYVPTLPRRVGVVAIVAALVVAVKFTGWYPEHIRNQPPRQEREQ
jgi:hypothetical protein